LTFPEFIANSEKMTMTPHPYQEIGRDFLVAHRFALLADEQGLGKTGQAILAAKKLRAKEIWVICRAVATINWQREFDLWWPEHHTGKNKVIIRIHSFEQMDKIPLDAKADILIGDEGHFLKNPHAIRTQEFFGKNGLVRRSARCWILTGSPMPNHPGELWPMLYTFGVTKLDYDSWINRYCTSYQPHPHRTQITGAKNNLLPELAKIIKPIMLRRKASEHLNLPPLVFSKLIVEPPKSIDLGLYSSFVKYVFPTDETKELARLIEQQTNTTRTVIDGKLTFKGLQALQMLAKSITTLRMYNSIAKLEPIIELVRDELSSNAYDKIVIFGIYRDTIATLQRELADFNPVTVYGGTPKEKAQRHIDSFQQNAKTRILLGNIISAGTSITLTAANQVLFVDQEWSPEHNVQAAKRAHRIGQKKPVFVRFACLPGSIDEHVNEMLLEKSTAIAKLLCDNEEKAACMEREVLSSLNFDKLLE